MSAVHVFERNEDQTFPGMGTVLILLACSVIWHSATPEAGWARTVGVILEGFALIATLRISGETPRLYRIATILVPIAIVVTAVGNAMEGHAGSVLAGVLGLLIVVACPFAIIRSVVKHPVVNLQTVGAAICIYLIFGLFFSYVLGIQYAIHGAPFMNGVPKGEPSSADILYFSFITLTTTGYGDITASTQIGRTTAMVEAMVGQLYLVTVLALLVSNLGQARHSRAQLRGAEHAVTEIEARRAEHARNPETAMNPENGPDDA